MNKNKPFEVYSVIIIEQLNKGIGFFSGKYKTQKYLAYFQSYTNTYMDVKELELMYQEALSHPDVIGLVISTRPDCVNNEIMDMISEISNNHYVSVEFGIESTLDKTLDSINRGHNYADTVNAIKMSASKGINTGGHLIMGLPGETHEDFLNHIREVSKLPLNTIKFHHLQIVKGTKMFKQYSESPELFNLFSAEKYIELCIDILEILNPDITIERFIAEAPLDLLVAPKWGLKNFEVNDKIVSRLRKLNKYQGINFQP